MYPMKNTQKTAVKIFRSGVESVLPKNLVSHNIILNDNILTCQDSSYDLSSFEHIYVTGFGKASASMAQAIENLLGKRITGGHIVTKYGHSVQLKWIEISEAGHPIPDYNGLEGTEKIVQIAGKAAIYDLVIVLISGGGSALLTDIPEGISLDDLKDTNRVLVNSGADIGEMNSVRKHLSRLKGGQLARLVYPATLLTLLISDVIGDSLDVISSGPTVADPTTFNDALRVVDKYNLEASIPPSVMDYLVKGQSGSIPETAKNGDPGLIRTRNFLLGNNETALLNSKNRAIKLGYEAIILSDKVSGDVKEVSEYLHSEIIAYSRVSENKRIALLFGGEPTVQPTGNGKGGRNQHLALLMAKKIAGMKGVTFLSAGTDGTDGPTDATGAICDGSTFQQATNLGMEIMEYTRNYDAYSFFEAVGGLLKTGPTHTNVMDLMIILIDK
jgi:glycerate 2-kinase